MSEFNIKLLREAVAWAEAEAAKPKQERRWNQASWAKRDIDKRWRKREATFLEEGAEELFRVVPVDCGTAFCVAGHICAAQRDVFVIPEWDFGYYKDRGGPALVRHVIPRGNTAAVSIFDRAWDLLGITEDEAFRLFDGSNNIKDVRRIAEKIARNHGETL